MDQYERRKLRQSFSEYQRIRRISSLKKEKTSFATTTPSACSTIIALYLERQLLGLKRACRAKRASAQPLEHERSISSEQCTSATRRYIIYGEMAKLVGTVMPGPATDTQFLTAWTLKPWEFGHHLLKRGPPHKGGSREVAKRNISHNSKMGPLSLMAPSSRTSYASDARLKDSWGFNRVYFKLIATVSSFIEEFPLGKMFHR